MARGSISLYFIESFKLAFQCSEEHPEQVPGNSSEDSAQEGVLRAPFVRIHTNMARTLPIQSPVQVHVLTSRCIQGCDVSHHICT